MDLTKSSVFLNEHLADKAVIRSLTREIRRLKGEKEMSKVLKLSNGNLYITHNDDGELIATNSEDLKDARDLREKLQAEVDALNDFIASAPIELLPTNEPVAPVSAPVEPVIPTVEPAQAQTPVDAPIDTATGMPLTPDQTPVSPPVDPGVVSSPSIQ